MIVLEEDVEQVEFATDEERSCHEITKRKNVI